MATRKEKKAARDFETMIRRLEVRAVGDASYLQEIAGQTGIDEEWMKEYDGILTAIRLLELCAPERAEAVKRSIPSLHMTAASGRRRNNLH